MSESNSAQFLYLQGRGVGGSVLTLFLMTRRNILFMETGLLHDYFGIFPCEVRIIFIWRGACKVRLNPHQVRLTQTSENLETQKNIGDDI